MAITDLTGYTWTGNSTLEDLDDYSIFIDFVCDGVAYSHINIRYLNGDIVEYGGTRVYQNNAWIDEKYRTITFTSNNSSWINWFESEGVLTKNITEPEEPSTTLKDLTNTTWQLSANEWSAVQGNPVAGEGVYSIYTVVRGEVYTHFAIGAYYEGDDNTIESDTDCIVFYDDANKSHSVVFYNDESVTFKIVGGADAKTTELIAWVEENGKQKSAAASEVVANIRKSREVSEALLSSANAKTGNNDTNLTDAVRALVDGYGQGEEVAEYDGTVVIEDAVKLISFKISGANKYQAEEGMTWSEWVASDYNTYGFTVSGSYIMRDTFTVVNTDYTPVNTTDVITDGGVYYEEN